MIRHLTLTVVLALIAMALLPSCAGRSYTNDYAAAAFFAGSAAILQASGGGCKIAGCTPGLMCNRSSGLCERIACLSGGNSNCPAGSRCDASSGTCLTM